MARLTHFAAIAALAVAVLALAATPASANKDRGTCGAPVELINPLTGTADFLNINAKPTFSLRETVVANSPASFSGAVVGTTLTGTFGLFDEDGDEVGYAVLSGTVVNKPNNDPEKSIINEQVTYVLLKPVGGGGKHGGKTFGPGSLVTLATVLNVPGPDTLVQPVVAGQGTGFCTAGGSGVVVLDQAAGNVLNFYL